MSSKFSVLFVCLGNICRSPTAEAVFAKRLKERSLDTQVSFESAGTAAYHVGETPDPRTIEHGQERGYEFVTRARQFEKSDFEDFDLIIAMDESNKKNIERLDAQGQYRDKVKMMLRYSKQNNYQEVPDPYYEGPQGFQIVLDLLEDACDGLIEHIVKNEL